MVVKQHPIRSFFQEKPGEAGQNYCMFCANCSEPKWVYAKEPREMRTHIRKCAFATAEAKQYGVRTEGEIRNNKKPKRKKQDLHIEQHIEGDLVEEFTPINSQSIVTPEKRRLTSVESSPSFNKGSVNTTFLKQRKLDSFHDTPLTPSEIKDFSYAVMKWLCLSGISFNAITLPSFYEMLKVFRPAMDVNNFKIELGKLFGRDITPPDLSFDE